MGGNAFKTLNLSRIRREDIQPTLQYVSAVLFEYSDVKLDIPFKYMIQNLLGSAGKQKDSGDLDIALDNILYSKQTLQDIAKKVRQEYGDEFANTKTLKGGQIQTAWSVVRADGNITPDQLVQIDFILGNADWLKFTHYSPGLDRSPYKGVFVSQCLGVLAKMQRDWTYPEGAIKDDRVWEVSWAYNLERGLCRRWRCRKQPNQNLSEVEPDWFETHCPVMPPRFIRTGYIAEPQEAVRILLGNDILPSHIETFEQLWDVLKRTKTQEFMEELTPRFQKSFFRSGGRRDYTLDELQAMPIFK